MDFKPPLNKQYKIILNQIVNDDGITYTFSIFSQRVEAMNISNLLSKFICLVMTVLFFIGCGKKDHKSALSNEAGNLVDNSVIGESNLNGNNGAKSKIDKNKVSISISKEHLSETDIQLFEQTLFDHNIPIAKLKQIIKHYDRELLHKVALKFKDQISDNRTKLNSSYDKIALLPLEDKLSKKGITLEREIKKLSRSVQALEFRLDIVHDALKQLAEEASGI